MTAASRIGNRMEVYACFEAVSPMPSTFVVGLARVPVLQLVYKNHPQFALGVNAVSVCRRRCVS